MLVIDASAAAELLLDLAAGDDVRRQCEDHGWNLYAPQLIDLEVLSVLRRKVATGDLGEERAADAVQDLMDLPLARYPHDVLVERVWELRRNFTPYDAAYLALAEAVSDDGVPILTADGRFARAADAHTSIAVIHVG